MNNEKELNDDIIQLLSGSSSSSRPSTSSKRNGRKKVSFSNIVETCDDFQLANPDERNDRDGRSDRNLSVGVHSLSTSGSSSNSNSRILIADPARTMVNDKEDLNDNLPSFSKPEKSNSLKNMNGYNSSGIIDVDDLFKIK